MKNNIYEITVNDFKDAIETCFNGGTLHTAPLGSCGLDVLLYGSREGRRKSVVSLRLYCKDVELLLTDTKGRFLFYGRHDRCRGIDYIANDYFRIFWENIDNIIGVAGDSDKKKEKIEMNELIKIEQKEGIETVNARELHVFLENGRKFSDWIKQRIYQYGFVDGQDFTIHKFVNGKATQYDYHVTVDMAKELSMVENNEKGKQARRYFIEVEKRAKELSSQKLPQTFSQALRLAAEQAERIEQLTPKAERLDKIASSDGLILPRDAGKIVTGHPNTFCQKLVDMGILYRSKRKLLPKAELQERGYFEVKESYNEIAEKTFVQTYFTPKGIDWITAKLEKDLEK